MRRILSFDIGIRNLAYCVVDEICDRSVIIRQWDIIDLTGSSHQQTNDVLLCGKCTKKAKYVRDSCDYYCAVHAKKSGLVINNSKPTNYNKFGKEELSPGRSSVIKKELVRQLVEYDRIHVLQLILPSKKVNAGYMDLIEIGRNMTIQFNELCDRGVFDNVTHVILENQIGPLAIRMKTVQGMISQYFIMKNMPNIEIMSSSCKLKNLENKEENGRDGYILNKTNGISYCRQLLATYDQNEWIAFLDKFKKKDDLADSFLQAVAFVSLNRK